MVEPQYKFNSANGRVKLVFITSEGLFAGNPKSRVKKEVN
jgi:hypothetical protein